MYTRVALKLRGATAPSTSTPAVGTQPRVILKLRGARAPIFERGTRAPPSVDQLLEQQNEAEAEAFWSAAEARLPKSAAYLHKLVPQCARDLTGCVLVAPADRTEWFMCLGEMVSLCEEATRRHAAALDMRPAPQAMPVAYLAERLDTDEPLWGWQVRDEANGWMQGFITLTTFTTWSATFEFNATRAETGLPAARLQNALVSSGRMTGDPTLYTAKNDDLVRDIAAAHGLTNAQLLELNREWFPELKPSHRLMKGTILRVESHETADLDRHPLPDDTPARVAARHMLPLDDLLASNAARFGDVVLEADTPLGGKAMLLRDRENEVEMPQIGARKAKAQRRGEGADGGGGVVQRRVDDGTLTRALAAVEHSGDPRTEGVVWSRIAEVGMVCALGCGGAVLRSVLRQLQQEAKYSHVVLQATLPAVGFYEGLGFVRVGAVAQYAPVGADLSTFPVTGYRHWMAPDELMAEQFGETSYLMALELGTWTAPGEVPTPRMVSDYPEITPMEQARSKDLRRHCSLEGGVQQCFESSEGVVVSLVPRPQDGAASIGRFRGEDLRMEVRYEVDAVIDKRGEGSELEYKVRWKVFPTPSWEPAANLEGSQAAIRAFEKRSGGAARKGASTAAGDTGAAASSSDLGGATGKGAAAKPKKPKPVLWWEQTEGYTPPPIRATNYALGTEGKGPDGRVWRVVQFAGGGRMHWAPCRDGKLEQPPKKQHSERQKQKRAPPDAATSADAAAR